MVKGMDPRDRPPTLLLTQRDVARLCTPDLALAAVREGFRALGESRATAPPPLHLALSHGGFHAKAAALAGAPGVATLKWNANFPANRERHGLPTIQGAVLLCDTDDGRLLAVMDSIEITLRRTAAASALAALHLARRESRVMALCGCGAQALPQFEALAGVLPLRELRLWDADPRAAPCLRALLGDRPDLDVRVATGLAEAVRDADVIVTCTPSRTAFLTRELVAPGAFVAAVGADHADKHELAPALMAAACVVTDSTAQCLAMGDLHHAVEGGAMTAAQVHAELADLVTGRRAGRPDARAVCVFDSTGVAVQDVALAAALLRAARTQGLGLAIDLGAAPPDHATRQRRLE
jgi:ornithine cyclodeaminase/alanine dehydrogenase-like protein (mu-crystallin family)